MNQKINLQQKLALFDDLWSPKIIAEANGQLIKLAKGEGELVWHQHENEDELFLVLQGKLTLLFEQYQVELTSGELYVVPKGVRHCPRAEPNTHFLLVEPRSTQHTGDEISEQTIAVADQAYI